ncbi:MAG: FAD-dependent monooxygenase [Prevotellaceae bacterium]|nr:FAD-dependent monooxygenase [Candidatus Faecinaster equi]
MTQDIQIRVTPKVAATPTLLKNELGKVLTLTPNDITDYYILKNSIDARQRTIYINLTIRVYINEEPPKQPYNEIEYQDVSNGKMVVIVGAGPAGLFAALKLIELGLRPVILERGKDVFSRRVDLAQISRKHIVDPNSNYSFGEGGAGAFSDGKLYTRSTKRGDVNRILSIFCQHGASTKILSDAHPHIGSDRLPRVIESIRKTIINFGGEICFNSLVTNLLFDAKHKVCGVITETGKTYEGPVILATGHSARDVYRFLKADNIHLETKTLAIGVRLEHPAQLIDSIMYHNAEGKGQYLPTAQYRMTHQAEGRGVYSFCMCPGGLVVPAATGPEQIVVNGMSPAARNTHWSNSGMVVEVRPEDVNHFDCFDANEQQDELVMLRLQEHLEKMCYQQGNYSQTAPAERMADFVNGHLGNSLPSSSYTPGLVASPLHFWMPQFITKRLQSAFRQWGKSYKGFLTNEATVIAIETRTSSPVRIVRDNNTLHHISTEGLYPCGEGAGYAGGIVSAAIDGERCAEAVYRNLEII